MERHRKRELRDLNNRAWAGDKDVFPVGDSLDSSLKKNTAFIKRLRTGIAAPSVSTFAQELRTLSLHKYLSEIISACAEGLSKLKTPSDIAAGVEVFSALHQRFGPEDFTSYAGWYIGRALTTPDKAYLKSLKPEEREKEEKERVARHRALLRIATELWLVGGLRSLEDVARPDEAPKTKENSRPVNAGVVRSSSAGPRPIAADTEPFPLEVIKDLTAQDGEHVNLPMIVQFVKVFGWDLLGTRLMDDGATAGDDPPLAEPEMQQRFKNVLTRYCEGAIRHLIREQEHLHSQSRRNAEAYVRSGEIFEDRQANYEKQAKAQEKFSTNLQVLTQALGLEMPDLSEKDAGIATGDGSIGLVKAGDYLRGERDGAGIWEDEEERRFYENIIDLRDRVPPILLEESKKKAHEGDEAGSKRTDDKQEENTAPETKHPENAESTDKELGDQSTSIANRTVGAQVDALLTRLPDLTSKEAADQFAVDFCFLNSKASRNRLTKALEDVPKGRSDLLPFWARVVTTLGKYMHDVSHGLVSYLDDEFRSLQRRKQKDSLSGVRMSNIRYLAELTKFGLVPEHVIFHCLKVGLDDFSRMNIEIICTLLENCGRYLLRYPETSPRMKSFIETLQRKKGAQHLAQQERMLIENAIYYVNPPERAAIQLRERTPVDMFLRKIIYEDLTKRTLEKVAKQIRKLHWEEQEVVETIRKIFAKPWNMKYGNIHFLAIILGALNRYHQQFAISIIDDLLEGIAFGLETNDFRLNQRRLAEVKYLGELYVYRMIDSSVVFETMFKILRFGHGEWPRPDSICALDLPDDFFRVRLICSLLETCGMYYDKGPAKAKLDFFLSFFQYYVHTKEPLPMDIEFAVQDAFAIVRPQWKVASNLEEAGVAFAKACQEQSKDNEAGKLAEPTEMADLEAADEEIDLDGRRTPAIDADKSSDEEAEDVDENELVTTPPTDNTDEEEEEAIVVVRPEEQRDPEAEAEFDRELAKLMADSLETRKAERRPMFDVPLPMRRGREGATAGADSGDESQPQPQPSSTVKFSLLSKKGNRQQTRSIDLPADSTFALAHRTQQEAEKAEQRRIKQLVMNYDLREEVDNDGTNGSLNPSLSQRDMHHRRNGSHDKSGTRRQQQSRKLELSDVNWM